MNQDRKLAVIMFTDIVSYSSLMENDEDEALYILEISLQIIHASLKQFNGCCIKEIGDGTLSIFYSTTDAIACATQVLKLISDYPKLNLRIGLHLGDIIIEDKDVFGDGVNITARIEPLAPSNGIAISQHFYAQIRDKTSCKFKSLGFPKLKNISTKIEVFIWEPNKIVSIEKKMTDKGISSVKAAWYNYKFIIFMLISLGIGSFVWQQKWLGFKSSEPVKNSTNDVSKKSIAVLKFRNIGYFDKNQHFNEGLSEELLNLLTRIKELKVASRTSTWALPENITSIMVREKLNVNYMVEGSVRKLNDKVRITVQLIETQTGFHLWSETYDRKIQDSLSVQDEIALKIISSLKLLLSAESLKSLAVKQEIDPKAYELYLKAKALLRQPKALHSLHKSIELFNNALAIDNSFELAQAGKCKGLIELYLLTLANSDFQKAEMNCLAILSSKSYQSEVYNSLGELYLISGNLQEAENNFQAALTLDLSSVDALIGIARVNTRLNHYSMAEKYFIRAIQTAPNDSEAHEHYGTYLFQQGEYSRAINKYKKVILLTSNYDVAYNNLGGAYFANGDIKLGIESFKKSLEVKKNQEAYSNLGTAYFIEKKFLKAAAMYQQAIELAPDDYRYWGFLAEAFEQMPNKTSQAIHAYTQAAIKAEKIFIINNKSNELLVSLALYYAKLQKKQQALNLLQKLEGLDLFADFFYTMSMSYLALNDQKQALNYLGKAINKGYPKELAIADDSFKKLFNHQGFKELTE